jgi:hypothetical protein
VRDAEATLWAKAATNPFRIFSQASPAGTVFFGGIRAREACAALRRLPFCSSQVTFAARSKRARRNVPLPFWRHWLVLSTDRIFSDGALSRGQRMRELWNNWYEILASAEALATVIVIAVVGAGIVTLWQGRRR